MRHGKINLLADEQQRDVLCKLHVRSPIDYAITVFGPSLNLMQIKNVARMRNCPVGRMSHIRQSLNDPPQFQDMLKTPNEVPTKIRGTMLKTKWRSEEKQITIAASLQM